MRNELSKALNDLNECIEEYADMLEEMIEKGICREKTTEKNKREVLKQGKELDKVIQTMKDLQKFK